MKPGDTVIIYAGPHYGRVHKIVAVEGVLVKAIQVDTKDKVTALKCDCGLKTDCEVVS